MQGGIGPTGLSAEDPHALDITRQHLQWNMCFSHYGFQTLLLLSYR
jgi:hypothetical protein